MKSLLTLNEMFVSYCFTQSYISTGNHHQNYVSGNILVLITIFRFMNHGSVTNIFIANLSFGDILVIGFALPFRVSDILIYYILF